MTMRQWMGSRPGQLGAVIVGVRVDDVASHEAFAAEQSLPFHLVAGSTQETAEACGGLQNALGILEIAARQTVVIDPQGRVAKRYASVGSKGHSRTVLADSKSRTARPRG